MTAILIGIGVWLLLLGIIGLSCSLADGIEQWIGGEQE